MDKKRIALSFTPLALITLIIITTQLSNSLIKNVVSLVFIIYFLWAIIILINKKLK